MSFLFRYQWENEFQWKARNIFIKTHEDKFDDKRLASLSNAWANWRFHGCIYCSAVQSMLSELDGQLPDELHMAMKEIPAHRHLNEVKFQKSSQIQGVPSSQRKELVVGLKIFLPHDEASSNPISILVESAQKSKKELEFKDLGFKKYSSQEIVCEMAVVIEGKVIATGTAVSKKGSKRDCAEKALEILKSLQPVHVTNPPNHDILESVEKGDLVKAAFQNANKIDQSNVGNIMLRKMGWNGEGGLATHGISEPVFISSSFGRQGLGHSDGSVTIDKCSVEEKLVTFLCHSSEHEMKFSNSLSKEERALVHSLCKKYGLKHKSFGKGDNRYLVVSKN